MECWYKPWTWFKKGKRQPDWYPEMMEEIDEALFERKKVNAIRSRRQFTGEGLKEAKAFVDNRVLELKMQGYDV